MKYSARADQTARLTSLPVAALLLCFVLLTAAASRSAAAEDAAVPSESAGPAPADLDAAETEEEHREKEKLANVALVLLVGIASAGILLIAGVLIWGSRVRRISRHRDKAAPLDPLWYLRGSPPLQSGDKTRKEDRTAEPPADSPDSSAGHDPDDPAESPKPD